MAKKSFITSLLLVFGILMSGFAYAGHSSEFDVSIDRVIANNQALSQSKSNLVADDDIFFVSVDVTAVDDLEKGHIEISLRGRQSSDVVADATPVFNLFENQSFTGFLALELTDGLKREDDFELVVKVIDSRGRSEQKTYGFKTKQTSGIGRNLDVSLDRIIANSQVLAESRTTFVEESDVFNVAVEFTSLEDADFAHVEAILKDLTSGNVVADASPNFELLQNNEYSVLLNLELIDDLRKSDSFELTIRVVDAEGNSVRQTYGITMEGGKSSKGQLDVSFDRVEVEKSVVLEDEQNFIITGDNTKKLDIRVSFTSLEKVENARLEAVLVFDNGNVIADSTQITFNLSQDQKVAENLELELPGNFKQDSFQLRLRLIDADGNSIEKFYGLRITQQKFPFVVSSIVLSPEERVQAGKSLGIRVNVINSGVLPLENIFLKVTIEELGLSSTKFPDPIKNDGKEMITEDFIIRIPESAQPGAYTITAEVGSRLDSRKETKQISFEIVEQPEAVFEKSQLSVKVSISKQAMTNDGKETIYKLTLTNGDAQPNAYVITLDGAGWADLKMNEPTALIIGAKESRTINVYASTNEDIQGEHSFFVTVSSNGKALKQITLKADVLNVRKSYIVIFFKTVLMILLILLAISLAAFGAFYGVKNVLAKHDKEEVEEELVSEIPDAAQGEVYY